MASGAPRKSGKFNDPRGNPTTARALNTLTIPLIARPLQTANREQILLKEFQGQGRHHGYHRTDQVQVSFPTGAALVRGLPCVCAERCAEPIPNPTIVKTGTIGPTTMISRRPAPSCLLRRRFRIKMEQRQSSHSASTSKGRRSRRRAASATPRTPKRSTLASPTARPGPSLA